MTSDETKAEIIIATLGGAFLLFLWWRNAQTGAGTGLSGLLGLPAFQTTAAAQPGSGAAINIPAAVPGETVNYYGQPIVIPPLNLAPLPAAPATPQYGEGTCSCQDCGTANGGTSFADTASLAAFLAANPGPTAGGTIVSPSGAVIGNVSPTGVVTAAVSPGTPNGSTVVASTGADAGTWN